LLTLLVGAFHFALTALTAGHLQAYLFERAGKLVAYAYVLLTVSVVPWNLYFSLFERSGGQATPGKRWLGLTVCSVSGQRIGLGRAVVRTTTKLLPWEIGHVAVILLADVRVTGLVRDGGFAFDENTRFDLVPTALTLPVQAAGLLFFAVYVAMALCQSERRSVHDFVAGTRVVRRPSG